MNVILNDNTISITEDLSNLTNREIDLALARTIGYHPVQLDKNLYHSALDQSKNYFILKCYLGIYQQLKRLVIFPVVSLMTTGMSFRNQEV